MLSKYDLEFFVILVLSSYNLLTRSSFQRLLRKRNIKLDVNNYI